jgi:hypothetical protein
MIISPKGHLTEISFDRKLFSKNGHFTERFNRVENMIKATYCNELENLAEFYIFIWGSAPGGDEDI